MIVIMWLTGGKKQQTAAKASAPATQQPLPVEVNETKIADLQNRIQELQREQLAAQSASRSRTGSWVQQLRQQQSQSNYVLAIRLANAVKIRSRLSAENATIYLYLLPISP